MITNKVSFILPFRTDNGPREEIFQWHRKRLEYLFPQAEIVVGDSDPDKPFSASVARNNAFKRCSGDILFFNDTDTIFDPLNIVKAIKITQQRPGLGWVYPYDVYHSLDPESGRKVLNSPINIDLETTTLTDVFTFTDPTQNPDHAPPYSGLLCMDRASFEVVGGFDEEFPVPGFEDWSFKDAANFYLGYYTRIPGAVYHIWHPRNGCEDNPLLPICQQRWEYLRTTNDYKNWLT